MSGLSRECRTCCRKQQNKIQPANKKKQARIFQARKYEVHIFQQAASLFPAWPASGPESNASRTPAHSFSAPAGQNLPFTFSSRSCQSVNRQMLFLQLRFPRRENTRCIFFQHPKPSFPAWPANTSRCKSYYNLQQDNSFHSGASRPIPPATILSIPAHNPQQANFLPPGLAGRRLTFLPTTFLTSTKCHLPTRYRSPPFFKNPPIAIFPNILPTHLRHLYITIPSFHSSSFFYFLYCRHPPGFRLSVPPHPTTLPTSSISSVLLPLPAAASPTRRPNAKHSFARGCSLQGCRWCGRGARVSFFSFFYFFLLLSFLSPFQSPWRHGFAATPSFFFLFFLFIFFLSFCFCFYFCFFFLFFYFFIFAFFSLLFFLFIFLLIFYSCFFFVLSFCFCSYLCFLVFYFYVCFTFIFAFFVFSLCFFFLAFIFDSPFLFCLSFCFTFLPSSLQSLSSLSNRSPAIHFFSSAANLSHSIQPLPAAAKKKKNIGKRIHRG